MNQLSVGVDIGGTKISLVVINQQGEALARFKMPTESEAGADDVIQRIAESIKKLVVPFSQPIAGIGVGSPGLIDAQAGIIRDAVNLGWKEVAFVEMLSERLAQNWPIYIENDVMALVVGEKVFGAAQGYHDLAYLALGTGLGSAAILSSGDGLTMRKLSMEIGHLSIIPNDIRCNCGQLGCLETVLSGRGMMTNTMIYKQDFPDSPLAQSPEPDTALIISCAMQNDPLAIKVIDEVRYWLHHALLWLTATLSPEVIVMGGGMGQALAPFIIEDMQVRLAGHPILKAPVVVTAQLTDSAVGAASLSFM